MNKDPDKETESEVKLPGDGNGLVVVEAAPLQEGEIASNSNVYQQRLKSLGSLKRFNYGSANDYKAIFDYTKEYLNNEFNDKGYKGQITKKALKDISNNLFEEGTIIKKATDKAIAGYVFPSHFWKYKFWKEYDRTSKNGAIVHFLISVIAVRYEAERLIKEEKLTRQAVEGLKTELLLEQKKSYTIGNKGNKLISSKYTEGQFTKSKKLRDAIKMMEKALDTLLQEEKDTTN